MGKINMFALSSVEFFLEMKLKAEICNADPAAVGAYSATLNRLIDFTFDIQ